MTVVTPKFGMGASVLRVEDQTFITGAGRYTDDIAPERPAARLSCCARRSPRRSFTIGSTEAAQAGAGRASGADRRRSGASRRPALRRHAEAARRHPRADARHPDPVPRPGRTMSATPSPSSSPTRRALAQDAAELIEVDYDAEDAAAETATALDEDTPLVWPELGTQPRLHSTSSATRTKTDAAFAKAAQGRRASSSSTTGWSATTWRRARRSANGSRTRTASC